MADPFYITTAISYPNGRPHIGHAYEAVAGDAIARWHRLAGDDVFFMTGTDEHGLKMAQTARDRGVTPIALAEEMSAGFKEMDDLLDISYDRFIRTTEPDHYRASQALWRAMAANGDLYADRYEGWYSVRDEAFYDEKELIDGEGGVRLSPQGTPVEWTREESWFFRLSAYQDRLLEHYERNPDFILPESRRNEVLSFVRGGLSDLSISRTSFDWGVPVPDADGHVMYVWVDALTNYLTGIGYPDNSEIYKRYWPANLHVIGKDIVRFHAVYWPAFLMSAGLPLPRQIFGHGFLLNRGEKMSKSVGNVADPIALAQAFGKDTLRWFLLREVSFGQDGSYSAEAIVARNNGDLANNIGNLAQRSLSMIAKNCEGRVPPTAQDTDADRALYEQFSTITDSYMKEFKSHGLGRAADELIRLATFANQYIASEQPWVLRKSDPVRMAVVLGNVAEALRRIAILAQPFMPATSARLLDLLAQDVGARDFAALERPIVAGIALPPPEGLFPRLEDPVADNANADR